MDLEMVKREDGPRNPILQIEKCRVLEKQHSQSYPAGLGQPGRVHGLNQIKDRCFPLATFNLHPCPLADGCCSYIIYMPLSPQKHDSEHLPRGAEQGATRVCDSPDLRHLKADALAHPKFERVPFPSFKTSISWT